MEDSSLRSSASAREEETARALAQEPVFGITKSLFFRIVLPPGTGEQPSLSSGLSDAPRAWLNRRGSCDKQ
jgi:hypothetical protein